MTKDHRKNIRRLLEGSEAPIPPNDLKARLKKDIPESFRSSGSRTPSGWGREMWLIAATLLMVVGASLVALRTIEVMETEKAESFAVSASENVSDRTDAFLDALEPTPVEKEGNEALRMNVPLESEGRVGGPADSPIATSAQSTSTLPSSRFRQKDDADSSLDLHEQIAESPSADAPARSVRESKSELDRAQKAASPQAAPVVSPERMEQTYAGALADEESTGESLVGVSGRRLDAERRDATPIPLKIGHESVDAVRGALSAGRLPSRESVRVEELVAYFAPTAATPPAGDFSIGVEGGPMLLEARGPRILMRFEVLARRGARDEIVATNAVAEVSFNANVARFELLGLGGLATEPSVAATIVAGETLSVSYVVHLRPARDRQTQIGVFVLRWTNSDGQPMELREPVFFSHINEWSEASSSLKVATIVAAWAEYLTGADGAKREDLARLSTLLDTVLASQAPSDRTRELQSLIAATVTARQSEGR